jgi:6-pyruvoyltetrahydropterin/6-carboxytetrahydropterin synthase
LSIQQIYTIALERQFEAQHYLVGGDWGEENKIHTHRYRVEVRIRGGGLDKHGYLLDIVDLEQILENVIVSYQGKVLNDLGEFAGLNPSIEHLSYIFFQNLRGFIHAPNLRSMRIKIWENAIAWASYEEDLQ